MWKCICFVYLYCIHNGTVNINPGSNDWYIVYIAQCSSIVFSRWVDRFSRLSLSVYKRNKFDIFFLRLFILCVATRRRCQYFYIVSFFNSLQWVLKCIINEVYTAYAMCPKRNDFIILKIRRFHKSEFYSMSYKEINFLY